MGKKNATATIDVRQYKDKKRKTEGGRIDTAAASVVDESTPVGAHGKQKKDRVGSETSKTVAENTNSKTAKNTAGSSKKKKKQKQKHTETKLPTISDERLKAYGINPKKFKYFHQKKLLREQR